MKIHPNYLSLFGIVPPIIFCFFIYKGLYIPALIAMLGLGLDFIDGTVARATNKQSQFGELLDASLDRVTDFLLFAIFGIVGLVRIELVLLVILFSYLISYIRSKAELASKATIKLNVGIIERPERLMLLGVGLLVFIMFPELLSENNSNPLEFTFVILGVLSFITVLQRLKRAKELL